jgi:hypothetical protein
MFKVHGSQFTVKYAGRLEGWEAWKLESVKAKEKECIDDRLKNRNL